MSHLKERKGKNCLNCNAQVYGKFCSVCGQENLEPAESAWHLVAHFFNDITHFDGKFFSSLKLLLFKPGFLSSEYKLGRRNNYLNPVRMYVFTSFLFFLVFFYSVHLDEDFFQVSGDKSVMGSIARMDSDGYESFTKEVNEMDSAQLLSFTRAINKGQQLSRAQIESYRKYNRNTKEVYSVIKNPLHAISRLDSTNLHYFNQEVERMDAILFAKFTRALNEGEAMSRNSLRKYLDSSTGPRGIVFGNTYKNKAEYDSLEKAGRLDENWISRKLNRKMFDITERINRGDRTVMSSLFEALLHNFPQMFFVSLPLFALFLKLLYFRHKDFYLVSHGIYTVHLYIFYFIMLLLFIGLYKLQELTHWGWLQGGSTILLAFLLFYEYKAMRNFYGQRRAKTFVKFSLAVFWRIILISLLFAVFLILSFLKV